MFLSFKPAMITTRSVLPGCLQEKILVMNFSVRCAYSCWEQLGVSNSSTPQPFEAKELLPITSPWNWQRVYTRKWMVGRWSGFLLWAFWPIFSGALTVNFRECTGFFKWNLISWALLAKCWFQHLRFDIEKFQSLNPALRKKHGKQRST